MAKLEAGMTREQAFALLQEHNKDPFHIEHGETVEQTMRYFAREFDPENEEFWGIVGLLHDLDWEEHDDEPEQHTVYAAKDIEAAGGTPELVRAIQSHTSDFNPALPKPELQMEKILFATEELTGLIGAAIVMRPSKSVMDFEVKSLKKKFKDKRFAAGVSRDVIRSRCRHARLGAGRAVRPHHRGHAVLRSRSRHLQACGSVVPQASGRRSRHTTRGQVSPICRPAASAWSRASC